VVALWVETANTTLLETQRSEPYLNSQREVLKASTDLRLAQQEMAAFYSEIFGYPTREEMDDVHRTVTELRRELRALQRANRGTKTGLRQQSRASQSRNQHNSDRGTSS
jgi:polyhydroxyalkanoate synthase subunit PhaE